MTRVWKPSSSSPSRTAGNASFPAIPSSALKTSHVCTGGTVLQEQPDRNRKFMLGCAQTVEDGTSLWKPQEKRKRILCTNPDKANFNWPRMGVDARAYIRN